jgi:hypothetical protein
MRKSAAILATLVVCLVLSGTVLAGSYRSPSKDMTCDGTDCSDSTELVVSGGAISGGCTQDLVSYIAWDLTSNAGDSWANAKLTLTTSPPDVPFTTDAGTYTFALMQPNNHSWTPATGDPGYGVELATSAAVAVTAAGGEQIVFQSDALGAYFSGLKGNVASVAVIVKTGCTGPNHTIVLHDTGSGANEPDLIFYPGSGGTAVTLSTFRAADSGPNWPLVAGLVGLLGAALSVSIVIRRRYAVRQANR